METEADRLRSQLAEAKELLAEARGEIAWSPAIMPLVRRIDAFLAATDEAPAVAGGRMTDSSRENEHG